MLFKISRNDNVSDKMQMTSISISDANLFFASGLYFIYLNHFGNEISVNISPDYSDENRFMNSVKVYYSDGKSRSINIETRPLSLLNDECIYRCDEVKDIIRKTNGGESELKKINFGTTEEINHVRLTPSEIQTVISFCSGNRISMIASNLKRHVKTISSHKRNAMKKMQIKCDQDLYKWYKSLF